MSEEEEDPAISAKRRGDANSAAGRRILDRRLRRASERGKLQDMRLALEDGADPRAMDLAGFTSLHLAAENGHVEAVALLLEKVRNPRQKHFGEILHIASPILLHSGWG